MSFFNAFLKRENNIAYFAFIASFILSPWHYIPWHLVNSDGVFYLQIAQKINQFGIGSAFQIYNWPFLSILIAASQKLTHLDYASAAFLFEAFLYGFSALFFVKILEKLGANSRTLLLAILVFLAFLPINSYRLTIFKDIGYWTFYLSGVYYLLSYLEKPKLLFALLWFFSAVIAALFRIEGIGIILLAPLLFWIIPGFTFKQRFKNYLMLYGPALICLFILPVVALFDWQKTVLTFNFLTTYGSKLINGHLGAIFFWQDFLPLSQRFKTSFLPHVAKNGMATIVLFSGLTIYFLYKFIKVVGILNWALAWISRKKAALPFSKQQTWLFSGLLFISLAIPYNFLLQRIFVNTRYLSSASLLILMLVPFALEYCLSHPTLAISRLFYKTNNRHARYFNAKNLAKLYFVLAALSIIYFTVHIYIKNNFSSNVQIASWLDKNREQLSYACTTHVSLTFIIAGPTMEDARSSFHMAQLLNPKTNCQYIVFRSIPRHYEQLSILQNAPGWQLYKTFKTRHPNTSTYIYVNTQFKNNPDFQSELQ